uniref:Uncharacterized protein n=1 Tax=Branchiostoma floridae TaxID=7739 RepID=C3YSW6_BRAFL|eukprot:XP_002600618.1 hypothetical protein BRAFLDRAFT_95132 [Branchiostoma floridae]
MPYKGKAATHSGQGKDTIQPKNDTYMCHALAGLDKPENSTEAPALSGGGGSMCESPHPPNESSVHINPLLCEQMDNPVYGHDLEGEGTDPDTDLRPASMQPYAVRYQEEGADADKDHRPASVDPYAVRYQDEDAADDNSLSREMEAAGTSGNDAGTSRNDAGTSRNDASTFGNDTVTSRNDTDTSMPRRNDRNMSGTRKPRNAQGAAGGTTPMQQTDWQALADAAASIPNPMYASRTDRMSPAGVSGRCALCIFIRSQLIYMAAGIAVLLSIIAMGLALLAFINNEEMSELNTTVDTLKRDQDDMRQLPTTVHALKLDLDKERSRTVPASEQHLDKTSKTTVHMGSLGFLRLVILVAQHLNDAERDYNGQNPYTQDDVRKEKLHRIWTASENEATIAGTACPNRRPRGPSREPTDGRRHINTQYAEWPMPFHPAHRYNDTYSDWFKSFHPCHGSSPTTARVKTASPQTSSVVTTMVTYYCWRRWKEEDETMERVVAEMLVSAKKGRECSSLALPTQENQISFCLDDEVPKRRTDRERERQCVTTFDEDMRSIVRGIRCCFLIIRHQKIHPVILLDTTSGLCPSKNIDTLTWNAYCIQS